MKNWWVWSSHDLIDWTLKTVLDPRDTPAMPSEYDECWATDGGASITSLFAPQSHSASPYPPSGLAPDAAEKDGSYYFYLSMVGRRATLRWAVQQAGGPRPVACAHPPFCRAPQGPTEIGVVRSTVSPTGPWEDVIGVPLVQ